MTATCSFEPAILIFERSKTVHSSDCGTSGIDQFIYFIPLKTNGRPLYLKTQSVPRSKHFSSRL